MGVRECVGGRGCEGVCEVMKRLQSRLLEMF